MMPVDSSTTVMLRRPPFMMVVPGERRRGGVGVVAVVRVHEGDSRPSAPWGSCVRSTEPSKFVISLNSLSVGSSVELAPHAEVR